MLHRLGVDLIGRQSAHALIPDILRPAARAAAGRRSGLLLADCNARWSDYNSALSALDAAEALQGALPPEYEAKRREWRTAERAA